jgi:hypothetical protein
MTYTNMLAVALVQLQVSHTASDTDSFIGNSNSVAQVFQSDKPVVAHHAMDG